LFISKSIVEAHGGRIWAENYGSDRQKGAVFYFTIPLNK
jgi:signal transduction histidine kinase